MNKKFKIYSLGCKVNQYDSNHLGELLKSSGFVLVEEGADLVIISTCAVTKSAISKNKRMVNKARKENPGAKIILVGCWPRVYDVKPEDCGADVVLPIKDDQTLVKKIVNCQLQTIKNVDISRLKDKCRYFLKVQDGCEQFCAYCIIPYTRGKLQSRKLKDVLKEAKKAVRAGFHEVVLSGIHLGLYGINNVDKKTEEKGVDLVCLLKELIKIKGLERIRLSSIEITEVNDRLIELMASEKKICDHLHISLQSGCNKTLKAMKRPYTCAYFKKRIDKLRRSIPDIAINTDVIVGFPGETNKDFDLTKKFIKNMAFSRLHVFSFSAHEKTPAFKMTPKVSPDLIKKRSKELRALDMELQKEYKSKFKGQTLELLVEAIRGDKIKGKSEYFFDIWFKKEDMTSKPKKIDEGLVGKLVKVRI
ncbi:tRNA (N(6)-L-threonylcarbamoyladenosine(37)-C(2))-methylthiotransferase MtaB [Candidatus Falkowbacteria bacterium]|nr:tRNA (N(6)-L-threonylcarbamoyladenosine(37)-C(2))-methylthiotransferase MtaB [Candidatus Falkowbacteria bacterium]